LTAVEIGKPIGARVIAAASTPEKLRVAADRGADALINYSSEKLTDRVMALTDGAGANVCFDPVGDELFHAALSSLGWGGRILIIGFVAGGPSIPVSHALLLTQLNGFHLKVPHVNGTIIWPEGKLLWVGSRTGGVVFAYLLMPPSPS